MEFRPKKKEEQKKEVAYGKVKEFAEGVGYVESVFEDDTGIIYVEQSANCPCCKGIVNMCQGEMCEQLGTCYCVVHMQHEFM